VGVTSCRWRVMFISLGTFSMQISLYCGLHKNDKILEIWIYTYWDRHVCKTQTTSKFGRTNFIPCNKTLCKFKMSAFCWNLLTDSCMQQTYRGVIGYYTHSPFPIHHATNTSYLAKMIKRQKRRPRTKILVYHPLDIMQILERTNLIKLYWIVLKAVPLNWNLEESFRRSK
jgi:hypothetical protein